MAPQRPHGTRRMPGDATRRLVAELASRRCEAGWSQREVANRLGLSCGSVRNWEKGIRIPALANLEGYAALFGLRLALADASGRTVPGGRPPLIQLAARRLETGRVQQWAARRVGVHSITLSRWETGRGPAPVDGIDRYAALFGLRLVLAPAAELIGVAS